MTLNERKTKILEAIVMDYIATAEPIGSRTISKKYDMGISSATIRNEMSDLEDLGLILQPHTSAGRVPSDLGYRLYVDNLMRHRPLTDDETLFLQRMIINNIHQADYLMRETAKAVALLTRYATVVSAPKAPKTQITHVQLLPMDERAIVVVCVTDAKTVRNKTLFAENPPTPAVLAQLSEALNRHLHDAPGGLDNISQDTVALLLHDFGAHAQLLMPILGVLADAARTESPVYTSGVNNFLAFPEFADRESLQEVVRALEERQLLAALLGETENDGDTPDDIQIIIGTESKLTPLQNCSIVRAKYSMGSQSTGYIGIIGPTRMDYAQAVSVMRGMVQNITTVMQALKGG